MLLDNSTVYSAPLSEDLAGKLQSETIRQLLLLPETGRVGTGRQPILKFTSAEEHCPLMSPLQVPVVFQHLRKSTIKNSTLAGFFALLAVGFVIYYRYREPWIVLPMVLINASEVIILLGFISLIRFQMDLPTIAGIIAILGTVV